MPSQPIESSSSLVAQSPDGSVDGCAVLAPRLLSVPVLTLAIVADFVLTTAAVGLFALGWLDPVDRATHGFINQTLIANLMLLAVIVGGIILGLGRLRPHDVGLRAARIGPAALAVALIWLAMQVATGLWNLAGGHGLPIDPAWARFGALTVLGTLLSQLFGNALYEEVMWRGVVLPQLYRRFAARGRHGPARGLLVGALVAALVVSQGLFALRHIPVNVWNGVSAGELATTIASIFVLGVIFAALYLRTRNLFVVVGVHALWDAPTTLFASGFVPAHLVLVLIALILLLWPRVLSLPARR